MQPALPRNIVVIDVERFSTRTNTEQLAIREGMYRAVEVAFTSADIPWTTCHVEDRGDGMMILISSDVPKLRLFERLPDLLNNELRAHNARVRDEVRIRLRIAIHAGEVYEDRQGVVADAVNQTFRLVATPLLKAALASSASDLVVIVSDWCYQEVVRNHPSAQPQTYQRVDVAVKETRTIGWIRVPGRAPGAALARPDTGRSLDGAPLTAPQEHIVRPRPTTPPADILSLLVDVFLDIPSVLDDLSRRAVIDQLTPRVASAIPYHPRPRQHVFGILMTCFNYPGAFAQLVGAVRTFEGDSLAMRQLDQTIASLVPWLPPG